MELIDRQALLDALYEKEYSILCPLDEVSEVVNDAPTVDAVQVVRCKDCKLWCRNCGVVDSPNGHCFCHDIETNGHDFCSYGERRTDG